jgi:hypothetical protein
MGSRTATFVESSDAAGASTQWVIVLPPLADPVYDVTRNALASGWQPLGARGAVAGFRRDGEEMMVAATRTDRGAVLIINVVRPR